MNRQEVTADPAGNLTPGTQIGSRFRIQRYVSSGGMGFIYLGEDLQSGAQVAIKVMREQLRRGDASAVKRFEREARTVSQLHHPNTIRVFDFGSTQAGLLYIVMEWLEGVDLADYLAQYGTLRPARAAFMTAAIARSLAEAHAKGIIHRDLKPENIFLVRTPEGGDLIKVLDFGIAKLVGGPAVTQITRIGMVCGTPDFMSPEQGRGEDLDGRSDLYALGCLLYTLLVGQTPFPAETPLKVVMRHQLEPFPALPTSFPQVLSTIIKRATEKDQKNRFPDAVSMANVLDTFVATADAYLYTARATGIMPAMGLSGVHVPHDTSPDQPKHDSAPPPAATPEPPANHDSGNGNVLRKAPPPPTGAKAVPPGQVPGRQPNATMLMPQTRRSSSESSGGGVGTMLVLGLIIAVVLGVGIAALVLALG